MLWKYIKERTLCYPEQRIYDVSGHQTFGELIENAERTAKILSRQKYGILCQSDLLCATAILACMAAGVTAVPLSNRYGEQHNKRIMEAMQLSALLVDEGGRLVVREDYAKHDMEPELEDVAWILSTSGTTGKPKGVMLTQDAILQNLMESDKFFLSQPGDKVLAGRGFFHCSSLTGELLMSLIRGVDIYCYSGGFQPHQLLEEMEKENITVYSGTPTVFYYLCQTMKRRQNNLKLRYCNVGGEMMNRQSISAIRRELPKTRFIHSYGLTETCSRATYMNLSDTPLSDGQKRGGLFSLDVRCVGRTLPCVSAIIVDEHGNQLGSSQEGEVLLTGKSIMKGYYHDKHTTDGSLENGWLKTGDMGWMDSKGMLHICGRKDDMIIRAGVNVYPQEIEQALKDNHCIKDVKVYAEKEHVTKRVAASVILEEGYRLSPKELLAMCRRILSRHQVPDQIRIVGEFELSQAGKIR